MGSIVQSMFILGNAYFLNFSTVTREVDGVSVVAEPSRIATGNDASEGYTYIPDFGTYKVHSKAAPWNTGRKICRQEGAHLAIINSDAEAKHIAELARNSGPQISSNYPKQFSVGIHNLYHYDEWVTIFGDSLITAGFSGWYVGEPNRNDKACGSINYENGKLYDSSCETALGFICEKSQYVYF